MAAVAALAFASADVALAQDDSDTPDIITVTAQFREQNLQETPLAITAVNAEIMDARSQHSIEQVAAQVPSLSLAPRGAAYGPSMAISIRGVGQTDFNPAYEPGVGMYVDDVYYATLTGSIMDLLDLDRVEVLRGPQGTLAGRNSIGGAVKLYSRLPSGEDEGSLSVTMGEGERLDLRGSVDFALTDSLFARLSAVSKRQDGYVKRLDFGCVYPGLGIPRNMSSNTDCVLAKEGEVAYDGVRGILQWDAGGPIRATLIGDFTDDERVGPASVLIYGNYNIPPAFLADIDPYGSGLPLSVFVPPPGSYYNFASYVMEPTANRPGRITDGRAFFRGWGGSGKLEWDIADSLTLESVTAYREYESGFSNDNDQSPLNQQIGDGSLDFWSWSEEVRLNGAVGPVEWTLGAFYMDQQSRYPSYQDLRYSLPAFQQDDPVDADSAAVFAHVAWSPIDPLTLTGGVRYTEESKDYHFSRRSPDGGAAPPQLSPLDGLTGSYSGEKVDYRVAVQYQWTDTLMTYLQAATGFKGGGVNPRPFVAEQAVGFDPEELVSYEAGVKSELFDRRLRTNLAVFFSDYTGIQLSANTCPELTPDADPQPPCALPINGGDGEMKGVELEAAWEPVDGLLIDTAGSWLDFEYTRINPRAAGIQFGNPLPYTPEWKWSVGAQYSAYLSEDVSITPRLDVSYQDDIYTTGSAAPTSFIEGYTLANARLTWRNEARDLDVALQVTNLTDEYYLRDIYDAASRAGLAYGSPGRPREWAVTIKKAF